MSHNIYSEEPKALKYLVKIIKYNPQKMFYFEVFFANTFEEACKMAKLDRGILGKSILVRQGKNKYIRKEGILKEFQKRARKRNEKMAAKNNIQKRNKNII